MSYYGPAQSSTAKDSKKEQSGGQPSLSRVEHFNKYNKRLRKDVRIVPWRDEWELQAVGKALLSVVEDQHDDIEVVVGPQRHHHDQGMTILEAFETISVWKSRLNVTDGLPHAIESTAAIAQVYWRDSQRRLMMMQATSRWGVPMMMYSVMELRLAYASAVVRCINGFADAIQQQRAMAASVANLCGYLGIPTWLVDVRHEASHNALPSVEVLRLAASTLLDFLKTEFWIPTCKDWKKQKGGGIANDNTNNNTQNQDGVDKKTETNRTPIDLLVEYKTFASSYWSTSSNNSDSNNDNTAVSNETYKKRKIKSSNISDPPRTRILPYDPLFGEIGDLDSSDDDDDDDDEKGDWEDPMVGNIWGSALGKTTNRFALLEQPSKKKKKKATKETKKRKTKKKSEKTPTDVAKLIVKAFTLQEASSEIIRFLVWGGVGGSPSGRGVLIPGSEKAFPATQQGITKCWKRYSPLIYVICRTWPGFSATLLIHLVDFVLAIEEQVVANGNMDPGSARKLFFLSSWIRLLLSQRFVIALDQSLRIDQRKGNNSTGELALATLDQLNCLAYPLNSLFDRCRDCHDIQDMETSGDDPSNSMQHGPAEDLRKTSRDILQSLEEILGSKQIRNFGYLELDTYSVGVNIDSANMEKEEEEETPTSIEIATVNLTPKKSGNISLDEMEALLSDHCEQQQDSTPLPEQNGDGEIKPGFRPSDEASEEHQPVRPTWVRCKVWDPCALGTLPGYPM
jgi:hypothetical protein